MCIRDRAPAEQAAERVRVADGLREQLAVEEHVHPPRGLDAGHTLDDRLQPARIGTVLARHEPVARALEDRESLGLLGHHGHEPVSYTHLRAHETDSYLVCRLLLEKKK